MATTIADTRIISTPAVYVTDIQYAVKPNTVRMKFGGEIDVRTASGGGGVVSIVAGVNAEKMLSEVQFELFATASNIAAVRAWKARGNNGESETLRLVDVADQYAFDSMYLANEPEVEMKADGFMRVEFKGRYVQ